MLKPLTNLSMMERNHMNAQNVTQEHMVFSRKNIFAPNVANPSQEAQETVDFFDHIAIKHKGVNLYDCSDCSVGFLLETALKIHISTVHGNNVGSICPICGRILKTANVLKDHISNMHEGKVKPRFNSSLCEEAYAGKEVLEIVSCSC